MKVKDVTRENHSLTAAAERRLLVHIAERIPQAINSDHLTSLGFLAMVAAGLTYWYAHWNRYALFAVIGWLAINWLGDSLDGTLARVRHHERPRYGFYVDHILDAFGMAILFFGLAASGYMSWRATLLFLVAYFLLCIEIYLATHTLGTFQLSFAGIGPTELRLILSLGNVVAFFRPMSHIFGAEYRLFDVGGIVAAVGMTAIAIHAAVRHARELYLQEPLPNGKFPRATSQKVTA
jgi:phosphatidylglycerophosphate synthase